MNQQEFERFTKTDPTTLTNAELEDFAVRSWAAAGKLVHSTNDADQFDHMTYIRRNTALLEEIGNRIQSGQYEASLLPCLG